MLKRTLEPEVMDTPEDAIEYDAMDFGDTNTRFAEDALVLAGAAGHTGRPLEVLDIGTGTGRIPVLMLDRKPTLHILAVDLAVEMIRVAAARIAQAGYSAVCKVEKQDAKALQVASERYDLVISNSLAHHIPDPVGLFAEIARVVRPEGAVIVRDLIRPNSKEDAWATVERVAAGENPRQKQLFFDSLCAALTVAEVEDYIRQAGLERMEVKQISDRHWTAERPRVVE